MSKLFAKLNLKEQKEIVVLNAPEEFEPELEALHGVKVHRRVPQGQPVGFALAFVTTLAGVEEAARLLTASTTEDPLLWFAYPKGTSRRYRCEFNRDTGWQSLGDLGYEGVRMVAIDEDWSALRFRRAENLRSMKRDPRRALSAAGRQRARARR